MNASRRRHVFAAGILSTSLVAASLPRLSQAQSPALRLRTSPPFEACLAPVLRSFSSETGVRVAVAAGDPRSTVDADVVVGDDAEMTGVLEGWVADPRTSVDVGYVAPSRRVAGDRLLVAVAAEVVTASPSPDVRRLLQFLGTDRARQVFAQCSGETPAVQQRLAPDQVRASSTGAAARFAVEVVDWWLPACTMFKNEYREARDVLGAPDAVNLNQREGRRDRFGHPLYTGIMSLGQGGYVTVDMGQRINDAAGADVRVYQITSGEEVTVYAGENPQGPFTLLGFRRYCGNRAPGSYAAATGYCDFDLRDGGLTGARYLKIEDGEIYPCLQGSTLSEGADIDAIELLNP